MPKEKVNCLADSPHESEFDQTKLVDTWFMQLAHMSNNHVKKTDIENIFDSVDFITFNYDRTIERFFPQILAGHFGVSTDAVVRAMGKRKVIHPYGWVGPLGHQNTGGIPFGSDGRGALLSASADIRTFDEGVLDKQLLEDMRYLVGNAETIVFLGFAFHSQNIELLAPGYPCDTKRVYATTLGLSASEVRGVTADLSLMLGHPLWSPQTQGPPGIEFEAQAVSAFELLRQNTRSLLGSA
jgi:hypothetical protein